MTKVMVKEPHTITVLFSPRIRTDGELVRIRIQQDDAEIQLTTEQAVALVGQITARLAGREDKS